MVPLELDWQLTLWLACYTTGKGQLARTVFIDFTKAFNHVDHSVVIAQLTALVLPNIIIRWMYSFLHDRRQRVKIGDIVSEWCLDATRLIPWASDIRHFDWLIASCVWPVSM